MNDKETCKEILEIQFECDIGMVTVREFLFELLHTLWVEEEGFSGKRPFGNSGWKHAVEQALVANGVIEGELDSEGYILNSVGFDDCVLQLIRHMCGMEKA